MGGRKPLMIKNNQNEQSQQMMRNMNMVQSNVNGTPHRRQTGAIKPPVVSSRHNAHFNQPPQSQNVQTSQTLPTAQGQQQPSQQQQGQRVRRAPMPNNQGNNQMTMQSTSYRQY